MKNILEIQCPDEILLGLHMDSEQLADVIKKDAAITLFREGKLSSGMAAHWLGIPRVIFLLEAMKNGNATLLENSIDDLNRELSLL